MAIHSHLCDNERPLVFYIPINVHGITGHVLNEKQDLQFKGTNENELKHVVCYGEIELFSMALRKKMLDIIQGYIKC